MGNHGRRGSLQQGEEPPEPLAAPCARRSLLRTGGLGLLCSGLAPWLAACQQVPPEPLKLGMNAWVGYDPFVLARERGLIDARAVKVIELSSSSDTLRNFRNHLLDAACLTLDEVLRLADQGADVRVVAVLSESAGADVVMARPAVRDLAQLRGRTLAVEATTVGALMLQRLLQAARLQPADVHLINVEATEHIALLRSGRADAAVSYEPLAGAMRDEGLVPIFDSRQAPGDIVDVLAVSGQALERQPRQVEALLAGWQRGLAAVQQEPDLSAGLLAPGAGLAAQQYMDTFKGLRFYNATQSLALVSGQPKALGQASERLALTLQTMGLIRESPDWGRLLDASAALAVHKAQEAGA